jgi:hypothetical protein
LGSARVSRAGEGVSHSKTFLKWDCVELTPHLAKCVAARHCGQHARRVRYPIRRKRLHFLSTIHFALEPISSPALALDPAPDAAFVTEIFLSELAFEITLFARDDEAVDENETNRRGE